MRCAAQEGVTEVWLSSEDTGAYGRDLSTSLTALLDALTRELPRGVMLRVGMTNPPYILHQLEAVARWDGMGHDLASSCRRLIVGSTMCERGEERRSGCLS
jgi:hypothetical protein